MNPPDDRRHRGDVAPGGRRLEDRETLAWLALGAAALALLISIVIALGALGNADELEHQADRIELVVDRTTGVVLRLERDAHAQCGRTQQLRGDVNKVAAAAYLAVTGAARNPAATTDARARYRRLADAMAYAPATDCRRAIDDPLSYRRPPAIPFRTLDNAEVLRILAAGDLRR